MAKRTRTAEAVEKTEAQKADEELLKRSREHLKACIDAEEEERRLMKDDQRFADLDQWPSEVRAAREKDPNGARPCLTSDHLNQYLTQIVNDARKDKPGIKVRPIDDGADVKTARVLQELVRHIEDQSDAQIAYSTAIESAAKVGLGFFRVTTDYVAPDSFDQEIKIVRVPNTFACYLGSHISPDGSDAEEGWIFEEMSVADFKAKFPKAKNSRAAFDDLPEEVGTFWRSEEKIVVCEYFYVVRTQVDLLFLVDGTTVFADEFDGPEDMVEDRRPSARKSVKWCKHSGVEVLEKRDWAGKYIPIIEVVGRESFVDGKRKLWGLVRPAKDVLRAYNYWLSTITEKVGLAPKAPFILAEGQAEGHEHEWERANVENRAYLTYKPIDVANNVVAAPKRQEPSQVEAGMMAMLPLLERNVQTALGMFRASVGESESQQSGRAILALQRSSDTGTYHFGDNQAISIKHLGRILLDLAPRIIDTKRIVRLTGEDGTVTTAQIDPDQEQAVYEYQVGDQTKTSYNLGVGKYDVTVTVGPSYNTKRQEAAEAAVEMLKSQPEILKIAGDLIFKSMDWPMADKFAERFKRLLPPPLQDPADGQEPIPPQVAAQMAQMQEAGQLLQAENAELKSGAQQAREKVMADMEAKKAELQLKAQVQAQELQLEREKAQAKIELERMVAEAKLGLQQQEQQFQIECRAKDEAAKRDQELQAKVKEEEAPLLQNAMPMFAQTLQQMMQGFLQTLERIEAKQSEGMVAIAQAVSQPKKIGGIQRDEAGRLIGASVVPATVQ